MKKILSLLSVLFLTAGYGFAQEPAPSPASEPFLMEIEDVFSISGVGTLAKGRIERGKVKAGDEVDVVGVRPTRTTSVAGILKPPLREMQAEANTGDEVSIVLKGVAESDLSRGQVVASPGSVNACSVFKAKIDLLSPLAGGRKTPLASGNRPMVIIRSGIFSGVVTLPPGSEPITPGTQGVGIEIELSEPAPLENGQAITLREGSKVIATGEITELNLPE